MSCRRARISRTCPRTKAPSFASIRSHVSRTSLRSRSRQERTDEVDRLVALEDPVRRSGEREEDPDHHLERGAARPAPTGFTSSERFGRWFSRFCSATSTWCFTPLDCFVAFAISCLAARAERVVDLVERAGTANASAGGDHSEQHEVVEREPGRARHPPAGEPVDLGRIAAAMMNAENRRPRTSRSFQSASATDDDPTRDEGGDSCTASGADHPADLPTSRFDATFEPLYEHTFARYNGPLDGGRRACSPRRPGAQPQGHHGPAPAERSHLHHRALGLREVEPCLRHDLRRGAAALRRVALRLRAPVPPDDGEARRRLDRRPQPGDLDRPEDDVAQPALDGRHGHRDLRLPAPALRAGRAPALPGLRPADLRPVDRLDRRADPRAAGGHALHRQRAGRPRPQGRVSASSSKSSATRASRASRSTASSTRSTSRRRSTRSSSTRSRSSSTGW